MEVGLASPAAEAPAEPLPRVDVDRMDVPPVEPDVVDPPDDVDRIDKDDADLAPVATSAVRPGPDRPLPTCSQARPEIAKSIFVGSGV